MIMIKDVDGGSYVEVYEEVYYVCKECGFWFMMMMSYNIFSMGFDVLGYSLNL